MTGRSLGETANVREGRRRCHERSVRGAAGRHGEGTGQSSSWHPDTAVLLEPEFRSNGEGGVLTAGRGHRFRTRHPVSELPVGKVLSDSDAWR